MEVANDEESPCTMCFYLCQSKQHQIKHIIRRHKFEPNFSVTCNIDGCGKNYRIYNSYRQHLRRKHNINAAELERDNIVFQFDHHEENELHNPLELQNYEGMAISMETLQWCSAKFLINVREKFRMSQKAIKVLSDGVSSFLETFMLIIKEKCTREADPRTQMVGLNILQEIFSENDVSNLFSSVNTNSKLNNFLTNELNMVPAVEHVISKKMVWKTKRSNNIARRVLVEKNHSAFIVPFMDNLKNFLLSNEVVESIRNFQPNDNGIYTTVLDGSYYKQNELFTNNGLAITLYYDDFVPTNIQSSAAKSQKLGMFYWTLANVKPEIRSTKNSVQLYAIVKTKYLKEENALNIVLAPFIDDIKILQTQGVNVSYNNGHVINYKGSLLNFLGDTPAAAYIGGFKESVAANRPCRSCMILKDDLKSHIRENPILLRNINDHMQHLNDINEPNLTKAAKSFWQLIYGVNKESPLMKIPGFDVTQCLPQDSMHILSEGFVELVLRLFLCYCIVEKGLFSIHDLNKKIKHFSYGSLHRDKPSTIDGNDLDVTKKLHQTSSQILVLCFTLPFMVKDWIDDNLDEIEDLRDHYDCYLSMLQVVDLTLSYTISENSVNLLIRLIETFIAKFLLLYPDFFIPKIHFATHLPSYIRLFGPARQQWCFRFEAAHAYFKSLVPVIKNFKNIPISMAYRHQARVCSELFIDKNQTSNNFLYEGDIINNGPMIPLINLPFHELFAQFLINVDPNDCLVMRTPKVIRHGTTFEKKNIILWNNIQGDLPTFAEIKDIYVYSGKIYLLISVLMTRTFEFNLNAYLIHQEPTINFNIIELKDLIFPYGIPCFLYNEDKYALLMYHERCEFLG